jgi:hypothetical protein
MKHLKLYGLALLALAVSSLDAVARQAFQMPDIALGNIGPTAGATIRADINIKVEEAALADTFFIGMDVMPPFGVDAKSGTYPVLQIADAELLSDLATERTSGGSYGEVKRQWGTDLYDCVDRGLEEAVDDADVKDLSRFFNLEVASAKLVLRNMKLSHEVRVAAQTFSVANYGAATNSVVAYTEVLLATISFVADIQAAIERVRNNGTNPNTIVMSSPVYNRIRRAPLVQGFVGGTVGKGTEVTQNTIAAAFKDEGIERCLVGRARRKSSLKGQAHVAANVWANTWIWVGYCAKNASAMQDGGAGFTMHWNAEGGLFVSETYRDEKRRSNMVRVRQNTAEKVVDPTAGTLIATQYA